MYFYAFLLQKFEEGCQKRDELFLVYGLVTVDIQQVEQILDVVAWRLFSAHKIYERL